MFEFDPSSTYLSRDALTQPPEDPHQRIIDGLEQQVAARQQHFQQPLTPEGTALQQGFTKDLDHIREMQSSGYPPQHVADYLGQALERVDSRWSPNYIKKPPTFEDIANQFTGIIPVTGTPGHIVFRNGEPQIKEFDSQKNTEGTPSQSTMATAPSAPDGGAIPNESVSTLTADTVPTGARVPKKQLVVGQRAPEGHGLPKIQYQDEYAALRPDSLWVDPQGIVQEKISQKTHDERTQRAEFGDEKYEWYEANHVLREKDHTTQHWKVDGPSFAAAVKRLNEAAHPKPEKPDATTTLSQKDRMRLAAGYTKDRAAARKRIRTDLKDEADADGVELTTAQLNAKVKEQLDAEFGKDFQEYLQKYGTPPSVPPPAPAATPATPPSPTAAPQTPPPSAPPPAPAAAPATPPWHAPMLPPDISAVESKMRAQIQQYGSMANMPPEVRQAFLADVEQRKQLLGATQ